MAGLSGFDSSAVRPMVPSNGSSWMGNEPLSSSMPRRSFWGWLGSMR